MKYLILCAFLSILLFAIFTRLETTSTDRAIPNATQLPTPTASSSPTSSTPSTPAATPAPLQIPIDDFKNRITKKSFGTHVTPENSPVSPERFTGYHTAIDIEYGDVASDVKVYAVGDGTVVYSGTLSGYGGVEVLKVQFVGQERLVLYGHIKPSSLTPVGKAVKTGDIIGILGDGYSPETDNERKHLHFSIQRGATLSLRGYVQSKAELDNWIDPLSFYK